MKEKKGKSGGGAEYLIVERIDTKLSEAGMSRTELTAKVKQTKGKFALNTLPNWAARKTVPSADVALAIADALQCSVRWLITGDDDKEEEYTLEEKRLVDTYRKLDRQGRHEVKTLLSAKINRVDKETEPDAIALVEKKAVS